MSEPITLAITGATGFVGCAVLDHALKNGHQVRALTRREQSPRDRVTWLTGDLHDEAGLAALCQGADAIIHVAGLTSTPDVSQFEAANAAGTANVMAAAKAAKIKRFVFVSSLAARKPELSAYGASKARAEDLVKASKLDWTIVRPPAVYGPRDSDMFDLFRSAKMGIVPLPPRGATSIIYVSDLARLLAALTGKPRLKKIYEPDDGREGGWSHQELAQAIGKAMGKSRVFAPHLPESVLSAAASADKLLRGEKAKLTADRVGYMCHPNWVARSDRAVPKDIWQPKLSGEDGLKQTADWYRTEGWL